MFPKPIEKSTRSAQLAYQALLPVTLLHLAYARLIAVAVFCDPALPPISPTGNYWGRAYQNYEFLSNYGQVLNYSDMPRYMLNSLLITIPTVSGAVGLSAMAGFALGIYRFKCKPAAIFHVYRG